jgi:hypothetical protein
MLSDNIAVLLSALCLISPHVSALALPSRDGLIVPRQFDVMGGYKDYVNNPSDIGKYLFSGNRDRKDKPDPRQNCIFYVNSKDSKIGKEAAITFAALMNWLHPNQDYHTLYDVFNNHVAFSDDYGPLAAARDADQERPWFKLTSKEFALNCKGTVYLVVEPDQEIYSDAIWLTDEYDALVSLNGVAGPILEVDPNAILAGGQNIVMIPYREWIPSLSI